MTPERSDILNGWKEIAGYLGRDTRTVERWEKQRGLPVRRVPGAGRATVYAITSELDAWFKGDLLKHSDEVADGALEQMGPAEELPPSGVSTSSMSMGGMTTRGMGTSGLAVAERESAVPVPADLKRTESHPRLFPQRRVLTVGISVAAVLFMAAALWAAMHPESAGSDAHAAAVPAVVATSVRPAPSSRVPDVNDLVLRGIYAFEQRTPQSLATATMCFRHAIALDPGFAPAYADLANTYLLLREYAAVPDEQAYPMALEAAHKAVMLDPDLPQAHTSLGFADFFWLAQPLAAEHEFKLALSEDPRLGLAHHWYGSVLLHEGRYKQALEELSEAERLSPNSSAILSTRALALGLSGHRQEAIRLLKEIQSESPGITTPHQVLALLSLTPPRDMKLYLDEFTAVGIQRGDAVQIRANQQARAAYARGGESAVWQLLLAQEEKAHPAPAPRTMNMASLEFALGRNDQAFADVETALGQHERALATIQMDPRISAEVRRDPRYRRVLEQVGILPLLQPEAAAAP